MLKKIILATTVCAAALGLVAPSLADGNPNPGVLPIDSHAFGKTYAEWAAAWWQCEDCGHVWELEHGSGRSRPARVKLRARIASRPAASSSRLLKMDLRLYARFVAR